MAGNSSKKKRRGPGEGSIYQRKDGRWVGAVTIGRDAKGRPRRRWVYGKTQREVKDELVKLLGKQQEQLPIDPVKQTVGDFLTRWLHDCVAGKAPKTYRSYEQQIRLHLIPGIGWIKLNKLNPQHIQHLYSEKQKLGITRTVRLMHAVLHAALNQAVEWGLIYRNPADVVEIPKPKQIEQRALNPEESERFFEVAKDDRLHALYVLAVTSGLREGELLGLKWEDIDLEQGILGARRQFQKLSKKLMEDPRIAAQVLEWLDKNRGWAFLPIKSEKGRRTIALAEEAIVALKSHRARQAAERLALGELWQDFGLVFCTEIGTPISSHSNLLQRSFHPLLEKADLPRIRFHNLRHSHVSLLIEAGAELKDIQENVGHSSITLTADTYGHLFFSRKRIIARKMDEVIRAARSKRKRT